jgi:hypothetical protein
MQISLWLNIAVLVPVLVALAIDRPGVVEVFGARSPARGILQSIYFSILVVSAGLLVVQDPRAIAALLVVQIVYKLTTPFTVGRWTNPVVLSNLAITAVHLATVWSSREQLLG